MESHLTLTKTHDYLCPHFTDWKVKAVTYTRSHSWDSGGGPKSVSSCCATLSSLRIRGCISISRNETYVPFFLEHVGSEAHRGIYPTGTLKI